MSALALSALIAVQFCINLHVTWANDGYSVGAVFRVGTDDHLISAFKCAVDMASAQILFPADLRLGWDIQFVGHGNVNDGLKAVCELLEEHRTIAIFGPSDHAISRQLEAITGELEVPYIKVVDDHHPMYKQGRTTTNLYPAKQVIDAFIDLIAKWQWKQIVLVYKEERRIIPLSKFFEDEKMKHVKVSLIKIDNDDFLTAAKRMEAAEECTLLYTQRNRKNCPVEGFSRVLLDLSPPDAHNFLTAALKVGMIRLKHWYLFTSLDLLELNMEMFRHNHARFIGLSIFDNITNPTLNTTCVEHARQNWLLKHPHDVYFPKVESALMVDAVTAVAKAFSELADTFTFTGADNKGALCNLNERNARPLPNGLKLVEEIRSMVLPGLTGTMRFTQGERDNVSMHINFMGADGQFDQIGYWESGAHKHDKLNVSLDKEALVSHHLVLTNELKPHMRVTTIEERPYVMLKRNHYQFEGNDKFEGFCIDLLSRLSDDLGFTFTLHLVKDGSYGSKMLDENNETAWNGMIGEIVNGQAEMAVAPLTVNYHRAEVVDFTKPFLSLGISILYRIPDDHKPNMFSFLNPLSKEIWLWICVAAVSVTMSMFVIG